MRLQTDDEYSYYHACASKDTPNSLKQAKVCSISSLNFTIIRFVVNMYICKVFENQFGLLLLFLARILRRRLIQRTFSFKKKLMQNLNFIPC